MDNKTIISSISCVISPKKIVFQFIYEVIVTKSITRITATSYCLWQEDGTMNIILILFLIMSLMTAVIIVVSEERFFDNLRL